MTHEREGEPTCDIIGGFPFADPNCKGCGKPLTIDNAWMTDGCPCNSALGVNSMNETRWRLLMQLQQQQSTSQAEAMQALQARVKELENDLVDALDLKNGVGPSVMTALVNSRAEQQAKVERLEADRDSWQKQAEIQAGSLRTAQAEVERLQRLAVHCPDCGGDYAATGLEVGCQCKLLAEVERLKAISVCRCGDDFTAEDPGTCGNCLATYYQDRVRTGTVMAKVDR